MLVCGVNNGAKLWMDLRLAPMQGSIMDNLIDSLVCSFNGYSYETVGIIAGFFETPEQAFACAQKIRTTVNLDVDVCGSQLTVWL